MDSQEDEAASAGSDPVNRNPLIFKRRMTNPATSIESRESSSDLKDMRGLKDQIREAYDRTVLVPRCVELDRRADALLENRHHFLEALRDLKAALCE